MMARKTIKGNKLKQDIANYPEQTVLSAGLAGRCPRCGEGKLYRSLLKPVEHCSICDLDMSFAEEGDGPAVLVILLLGGVITGMVLAFHNLFNPPLWLHGVIWIPVTFALSIYALKIMKGIMITAQYKTKAAEGQLAGEDE